MIDKAELARAIGNPLKFALYFEDDGFLKPHYYLIMPTRNKNELIVLTMITSQIEKIELKYKNNPNALQALIYLDETRLPFLIKPSIIDCNNPRKTTVDEVLLMQKLRLLTADIPKELIRQIAEKINGSKVIRPNIKKMIDLSLIG